MKVSNTVLFMPGHRSQEANDLYIMRAVPGCGKTHRAGRIAAQVGGLILSADHFYGEGEEYRKNWSRERAHLGHRDCESKCLKAMKEKQKAMKEKQKAIIIDNTNISLQAFRYYLDVAVDHNYNVYFAYPDSEWWTDKVLPLLKQKESERDSYLISTVATFLHQKNTHGVPVETLMDMMKRFQWVTYDDFLDATEQKVEAAKKELAELENRLNKVRDLYL
jgi:flagellar biosynthesis chaperone FliJ